MKKIFERKLGKIILTTKEEKHLARLIFKMLDEQMIPGHDDFFRHECIGVYEYDKIKKKFGIIPRRKNEQ